MKDDDLIRGVAKALRDEEARDAKWERLAAGTITAEERRELEALAAHDPEAAEALAMYTPLGAGFEEEVAAGFLAGAETKSAEVKANAGANANANAGAKPSSGARVFRFASYVAAPLAIAAAALVWIGRSPAESTLPSYEIALASNLRGERGGEPQPATSSARLHRKAYFEAIARPSVPPREAVGARAVLVRDGSASAWNVPVAVSNEGAVRIAGPADTLFPQTTGAYDIVLAVGPAASLPSGTALAEQVQRGGVPPTYRVVRAHVEFAGD